MQYCSRIVNIRTTFQGIFYNFCFCFTSCENDGCYIWITGDGSQANGEGKSITGYLNSTQIYGRCSLSFEVCFQNSGSRIMVRATHIEGNVAIGTDPAEKKSNTTQVLNAILIFTTPLIHRKDCFFLTCLDVGLWFTVTQGKINDEIGKNILL